MGAAVEVFEDSRLIEVGRDRFVPVKTTNDLLVLRSDVYDLGSDFVLDQVSDGLPFVDLDGDYYKLLSEFDKRFPEGAPSMRKATSLTVDGDFTFGGRVQVVGEVELSTDAAERIPGDTVLTPDGSSDGPSDGSTNGRA
jgi:UTP--glucose-1-phosphate uridylyltransferase